MLDEIEQGRHRVGEQLPPWRYVSGAPYVHGCIPVAGKHRCTHESDCHVGTEQLAVPLSVRCAYDLTTCLRQEDLFHRLSDALEREPITAGGERVQVVTVGGLPLGIPRTSRDALDKVGSHLIALDRERVI